MGFDPIVFLEIYRPGVEIGLHDSETVFDLPSLCADFQYFRFFPLQGGCHTVIAIVAFFVSHFFEIDLLDQRGGYFSFGSDWCFFDEACRIVRPLLFFESFLLRFFQGPVDLSVPLRSLIGSVFRTVGDDVSFFAPIRSLCPPASEIARGIASRLVDLFESGPVFLAAACRAGFPVIPPFLVRFVENPFLQGVGHLFDRVRDDIRIPLEYAFYRFADGAASESGIGAVDEPVDFEVSLDPPDRFFVHRERFVPVSRIDAHIERDAVGIEKESHLDDGVGAVLFGHAVTAQFSPDLFDLHEEVRAVVKQDIGLSADDFIAGPVELQNDLRHIFGKDVERTVDILMSDGDRLEQKPGIQTASALRRRVEDAVVDHGEHDLRKVETDLVAFCGMRADRIEVQFVADLLKEQIAGLL